MNYFPIPLEANTSISFVRQDGVGGVFLIKCCVKEGIFIARVSRGAAPQEPAGAPGWLLVAGKLI